MFDKDYSQELAALAGKQVLVHVDRSENIAVGTLEEMGKDVYVVGNSTLVRAFEVYAIRGNSIFVMDSSYDENVPYDD